MSERKYPIGGYAPGGYQNTCISCKQKFLGDKRACQCEPCAIKSEAEYNAMTEDQKQKLADEINDYIRQIKISDR